MEKVGAGVGSTQSKNTYGNYMYLFFLRFDDILWFVLVTFSSVGYGDYYPCTDNGRIANGIFIILNQLTLAWFFTVATQLLIMRITFLSSKHSTEGQEIITIILYISPIRKILDIFNGVLSIQQNSDPSGDCGGFFSEGAFCFPYSKCIDFIQSYSV